MIICNVIIVIVWGSYATQPYKMTKSTARCWVDYDCSQFSSVPQLCLTLCDPMNCSMPGLPVHHQLLEFTQTHVHRVSDAIQPSLPLSSPSPPAPNPSQHQSFSNESTIHMRWPKYCSFSFSISPSNEHPGLISFRGLVGSPCGPRDSPESSPTSQFKSINSSAHSLD